MEFRGKAKRKLIIMFFIFIMLTALSVFSISEGTKSVRKREKNAKIIGVVLSKSDYTDIYHDNVTINCGKRYRLETPDGIRVVPANEQISVNKTDINIGEKYRFFCEYDECFEISTIKRSYGAGRYFGEIVVYNSDNGLVIVNRLPLETYLRFTVPSEMPASYGLSALMAQSVCARSFAVQHIKNPSFPEYEAHLDDSIRYQVYNNQVSNQITDDAIKKTENKVLMYGDEIVSTYYYSTSWGFSTDLSIWNGGECEYYINHELSELNKSKDLTSNEAFEEELANNKDTYEADEPWYRWSYVLSEKQLLENIRNYVKTDLSEINSITIAGRRAGGGVSSLVIVSKDKTFTYEKESEVRNIMIPFNTKVSRNDGSVLDGYSKCPSSFYKIDPVYDAGRLVEVKVSGGGCGHGLGMSQNCAKHLASQGKDYKDILTFFYPGTSVGNAK